MRYISQVDGNATRAVADAKRANADRFAPYEYTAAVAYLHKAREEGGYAAYQIAIEYGRRSEELAIRARAIAVDKGAARPGNPTGSEPSGRPGDSP